MDYFKTTILDDAYEKAPYFYVDESGVKYHWLSGDTCEVCGIENKDTSGNLVIPNQIVVSGSSYSVTGIGDFVFDECNSLTDITLPKGIKTIGECVFRECTSLSSVKLPENTTKLYSKMFSGCEKLSKVTMGTGKKLVIKVPAKKVSAYKKLFAGKGNEKVTINRM